MNRYHLMIKLVTLFFYRNVLEITASGTKYQNTEQNIEIFLNDLKYTLF